MIPVFKPSYDEQEWLALREPMMSGWVGLGPKTKEFEDAFAKYVRSNHAVGMNSASASLFLALKIHGVEGGEVITTPMTFVSTNHAILWNNATPVFADIEADTLNIRVDEIERLISQKTRAILVVHYGGHPCDMDPIHELARPRGIRVIEDAAHACGASYKGRRIGSLSDATCFSFHAVKNLATGEGGMVTINEPELDERLRRLRWLGINKDTWSRSEKEGKYSWYYWVDEVGFKCHMNDIPAAIGLVQLGKLERTNARRREIAAQYTRAFAGLDWLETPIERPYAASAWHNYVVKVEDRDRFIAHLAEKGIGTSVHYIPNHLYDIYANSRRSLPVAEEVWKRLVTLPLYPDLTDEQIAMIIEAVLSFRNI